MDGHEPPVSGVLLERFEKPPSGSSPSPGGDDDEIVDVQVWPAREGDERASSRQSDEPPPDLESAQTVAEPVGAPASSQGFREPSPFEAGTKMAKDTPGLIEPRGPDGHHARVVHRKR
jgi:hypothetical protein